MLFENQILRTSDGRQTFFNVTTSQLIPHEIGTSDKRCDFHIVTGFFHKTISVKGSCSCESN